MWPSRPPTTFVTKHVYPGISHVVASMTVSVCFAPLVTSAGCEMLCLSYYLMLLGLEETEINELLDHLEFYLMNRLYNVVFCSANSTDEQQDLSLQNRFLISACL